LWVQPLATTQSPFAQTFELEQNYPNPFNATTAIVYNLPNIGAQPAPVRLTIYNILGQEVKTLVDEPQPPESMWPIGMGGITWGGRSLRESISIRYKSAELILRRIGAWCW